MLKKFLSVVLSLTIAFTLFACGGNTTVSSDGYSSVDSNSNLRSQIENLSTVADTIKFGLDTNKNPIEWYIIADTGNEALLFSRYILTTKSYNDEQKDVTWESCTLRKWLNSDFINNTFSKKEQKSIILTDVINVDNRWHSNWTGKGGHNTKDKIFLLSIDELEKYESGKTKFEEDNYGGIAAFTPVGYENWWLRSPGKEQDRAAYVNKNTLYNAGTYVNDDYGIRPAMWVKC